MFVDYLKAYPARPSMDELATAISYLETKIHEYQDLSTFAPEFLQFLETGDISSLTDDGKMSKEIFEKTRSCVFCSIEMIYGRTVLARYLSGKQFSGFIPTDSPLDGIIQRGPCIVKHEESKILEWIPLDQKTMVTLGGLFNTVASKSK